MQCVLTRRVDSVETEQISIFIFVYLSFAVLNQLCNIINYNMGSYIATYIFAGG